MLCTIFIVPLIISQIASSLYAQYVSFEELLEAVLSPHPLKTNTVIINCNVKIIAILFFIMLHLVIIYLNIILNY